MSKITPTFLYRRRWLCVIPSFPSGEVGRGYIFLLASYVSMVFVWIKILVSPLCTYCDSFVITRVTLQPTIVKPIKMVAIISNFRIIVALSFKFWCKSTTNFNTVLVILTNRYWVDAFLSLISFSRVLPTGQIVRPAGRKYASRASFPPVRQRPYESACSA